MSGCSNVWMAEVIQRPPFQEPPLKSSQNGALVHSMHDINTSNGTLQSEKEKGPESFSSFFSFLLLLLFGFWRRLTKSYSQRLFMQRSISYFPGNNLCWMLTIHTSVDDVCSYQHWWLVHFPVVCSYQCWWLVHFPDSLCLLCVS